MKAEASAPAKVVTTSNLKVHTRALTTPSPPYIIANKHSLSPSDLQLQLCLTLVNVLVADEAEGPGSIQASPSAAARCAWAALDRPMGQYSFSAGLALVRDVLQRAQAQAQAQAQARVQVRVQVQEEEEDVRLGERIALALAAIAD